MSETKITPCRWCGFPPKVRQIRKGVVELEHCCNFKTRRHRLEVAIREWNEFHTESKELATLRAQLAEATAQRDHWERAYHEARAAANKHTETLFALGCVLKDGVWHYPNQRKSCMIHGAMHCTMDCYLQAGESILPPASPVTPEPAPADAGEGKP